GRRRATTRRAAWRAGSACMARRRPFDARPHRRRLRAALLRRRARSRGATAARRRGPWRAAARGGDRCPRGGGPLWRRARPAAARRACGLARRRRHRTRRDHRPRPRRVAGRCHPSTEPAARRGRRGGVLMSTTASATVSDEMRQAWRKAAVRPLWENTLAYKARTGGPPAHLWAWRELEPLV